ncbi:putative transcriptional regulators [Hyella patelloides LEGE 07179]|uniref:Putative transcriptional regulators n=1 Tax=Hyella patelloides LEGE 07179 TaxID=945734 RepID=A0A563VP11_9CYAN|nr:helix-turn-helix domain-containing protein [Hyella patelloides]VEP13163.1 putative transcriptional regulators [Hyella patelloides LEGE 07179]
MSLLKNKYRDSNNFNQMIVDCLGCKWTVLLLENIALGTNRPGKLAKVADGLTTKVLNQCLKRMIDYEILEKRSFSEIPPRVEYYLTPFGLELYQLLLELKNVHKKYFVASVET